MNKAIKVRLIIIGAIIMALLIGSVIAMFIIKERAKTGDIAAYIYQNDELVRVVDLSDSSQEYTFTITNESGGYNVLKVCNGAIGVESASCPDGLCINMGFISDSIMPITCLPNHLVIQIKGKEAQDTLLDGKVY